MFRVKSAKFPMETKNPGSGMTRQSTVIVFTRSEFVRKVISAILKERLGNVLEKALQNYDQEKGGGRGGRWIIRRGRWKSKRRKREQGERKMIRKLKIDFFHSTPTAKSKYFTKTFRIINYILFPPSPPPTWLEKKHFRTFEWKLKE
jgi:hypothetical protein